MLSATVSMVINIEGHSEVPDDQGYQWRKGNARLEQDSGTGTIAMESHLEVSRDQGYPYGAEISRVFEGTESPDDSIMPAKNTASQNLYQGRSSKP